jgi:RNA polymerase sigma factor (sigma-70 family)
MTPERFEALLRALDPDDRENAAMLYETLRRKLIRLFEWRDCASPEDLVDETFNRVARRLAEGVELQAKEPSSYFYGVAHHVYREVWRREAHKRKVLESGEWPPRVSEEVEPDPRLDALRLCLDKLGDEQRRLVLEYHQSEHHIQSRKKLSDELGIPINALRIRVHRLRRRLEECIQTRLSN